MFRGIQNAIAISRDLQLENGIQVRLLQDPRLSHGLEIRGQARKGTPGNHSLSRFSSIIRMIWIWTNRRPCFSKWSRLPSNSRIQMTRLRRRLNDNYYKDLNNTY